MSSEAERAWLADVGVSTPDARGFFERLGVSLGTSTGDQASVECFLNKAAHRHEDKVKSCSINVSTGLHKCHGCGVAGNAYSAAVGMGWSEEDARDLAKQFGLFSDSGSSNSTSRPRRSTGGGSTTSPTQPKARIPTEAKHRKWREALRTSPELLSRLLAVKAWTPGAIHRLSLGWDGERLTCPVRVPTKPTMKNHSTLKLDGFARYLPNAKAKGQSKTLAVGRRGLFPAPELLDRNQRLFLVEGEPDVVSMWSAGLRAIGIPGANSWKPEWVQRLSKFKEIIVICDCDKAGRDLSEQLHFSNAKVIDLEPPRDDGYDVGDFILEAYKADGVAAFPHVRQFFDYLAETA